MDLRIFLPRTHSWRDDVKSFNGEEEHRTAPSTLKGAEIFEILKDFNNDFGMTKKKKLMARERRGQFFLSCLTGLKIHCTII